MSQTMSQTAHGKDETTYLEETGHRTKVMHGSEALAEAIAKEPPKTFSRRSFQLYCFCAISAICSTSGAMMGVLWEECWS